MRWLIGTNVGARKAEGNQGAVAWHELLRLIIMLGDSTQYCAAGETPLQAAPALVCRHSEQSWPVVKQCNLRVMSKGQAKIAGSDGGRKRSSSSDTRPDVSANVSTFVNFLTRYGHLSTKGHTTIKKVTQNGVMVPSYKNQ